MWDFFPEELREKYKINDYLLEYDSTFEKENMFLSYVDDTVYEIESHINDKSFWIPETIDEKNSFFCNMLLSYKMPRKEIKFAYIVQWTIARKGLP